MIAIRQMLLHNSLFLSGTNLGTNLDTAKKTGLKIFLQERDNKNDRYVVTYNGKGKFISYSNVADAEPMDYKDLGLETELEAHKPAAPKVKTAGHASVRLKVSHTAQVGDPTRGIK